ncbi:24442_t:CDS:2 [Gigaspora margarita]|uniref:24442_t:CDS:1 n=1 Tax=Gigaspora margarita TaxID=4874 RepID=A0ABM8VZM0_GIGMA|nr:24442_t:CDS:2 [Gigaspora margarita]
MAATSAIFRLFMLFLIFLTAKQIIYHSLVSTVFEVLLTLTLLRPFSGAESHAIYQWYHNHSTCVEVSICSKNPAKNRVKSDCLDVQPSPKEKDDHKEDLDKEKKYDYEEELDKEKYDYKEKLDIFNFAIYLLLEMKFFAVKRFV